jgi:hypothetical protein
MWLNLPSDWFIISPKRKIQNSKFENKASLEFSNCLEVRLKKKTVFKIIRFLYLVFFIMCSQKMIKGYVLHIWFIAR